MLTAHRHIPAIPIVMPATGYPCDQSTRSAPMKNRQNAAPIPIIAPAAIQPMFHIHFTHHIPAFKQNRIRFQQPFIKLQVPLFKPFHKLLQKSSLFASGSVIYRSPVCRGIFRPSVSAPALFSDILTICSRASPVFPSVSPCRNILQTAAAKSP